jgi:ribosomal protein S6
LDPRITLQLKSILKVFPEFGNFVVKQEYNNENLGLLKNILTNIKSFSGRYKEYSRKEELYKDYKFEILKDVTEIDWYHATKRSNLASIKKVGIIPSKQFQHPQEYGWTTLNLDLQKSVTDLKGKVTAEETWGKKNFYFPIKKQTSGVYLQWKIELGLRQVSDLKKKLDYDENVLRYLLLQAK